MELHRGSLTDIEKITDWFNRSEIKAQPMNDTLVVLDILFSGKYFAKVVKHQLFKVITRFFCRKATFDDTPTSFSVYVVLTFTLHQWFSTFFGPWTTFEKKIYDGPLWYAYGRLHGRGGKGTGQRVQAYIVLAILHWQSITIINHE